MKRLCGKFLVQTLDPIVTVTLKMTVSIFAIRDHAEGSELVQVGPYTLMSQRFSLPDLFKWMGKRIAATTHLEIDIGRMGYGPTEDLLRDLRSSGHELNARIDTLVLTSHDWGRGMEDANPYATSLGRLRDFLLSSCPMLHTINLLLDKAPSWQVNGPSLRHICLRLPPSTCLYFCWEDSGTKELYEYMDLSGMQSVNLPNLQTLFLQGLQEPVRVRGIDFRDPTKFKVMNVHDCWFEDLSLPSSCKIFVSAQSNVFLDHLDGSRGHPFVSGASHVCLPTNLSEEVFAFTFTAESKEKLLQRHALGIPNMFQAMRCLHMTRPNNSIRCSKYDSYEVKHYFDNSTEHKEPRYSNMRLFNMRGLSRHWQHVNLKKLLVEGDSLGITVPALPNLEMLLVFCERNVALDFIDPKSLGLIIKKMSVVGKQIQFDRQQHGELCMALEARDLELVGDWSKCIAMCPNNTIVPTAAELREQAKLGFTCECKACPSCLGIGAAEFEKHDPLSRAP